MRIAFLLPNIEAGGTELQVLALARLLDRSRFSPSLVTTAGGGSLYRDFAALMPVTVFGSPQRHRPTRTGPAGHLRNLAALVRLYRSERPDLVHSFLPAANVYGPLASRLSGVPRVVVAKRSMAVYKEKHPVLTRAESLGNRLADAVLVNSDAVRREVERTERHWEGKIRKIYNGVALPAPWTEGEAARFRSREGIPPGAPLVLSVSNFFPYKGHADLLRAAARVIREVPEARFLLVGRDAGAMGACRELAAELRIGGNVLFAGARGDVDDCLRACDLFVHPSHQEGFSNAILEAMAAGKAVVATAVGGTPEAVSPGETGLLVPPGDPESLARATASLLLDPQEARRMGEAGRARAAGRFSLEGMARAMERLYEELAAGDFRP